MGRFQAARSMRCSLARCGGLGDSVDEEAGGFSMVSVMKAAIWGQTRGWREEQRITPIEGVVGDDMI
jgi:hypothetical protein